MPVLIAHGREPFNAETPAGLLVAAHLTPSDLHFVRSHGPVPRVDPASYRLVVEGLVRQALQLSLDDLRRLPRVEVAATLVCAGNRRDEFVPRVPGGVPWGPGAIGTAVWGGVRLRDVLEAAGVGDDGRHVSFAGLDVVAVATGTGSFGGSIPVTKALGDEVILASEMNGEPLPAEHGFPLRAVVPGYVGARSVKWLSAVSVAAAPSANHFHAVDYTLAGAPLGEQPLTSAICVAEVHGDALMLRGYALPGAGRAVERVEVSVDGGRSWLPADVDEWPRERWSWRLWHLEVAAPTPGSELVVRAFDGGDQPAQVRDLWNERGYMNNAWHHVVLGAGAANPTTSA